MTDPRIPVTLLTGFLGAGKTTLLNALLSDPSAGRIAVIVNEFGEAGLDHDLIESTDEEVVLMRSGCLCCSVRGDLSNTIADLVTRCENDELAFDRLVIETTGLADPGPILQTLLVDRYLARMTRMDGVVTVADAANGPTTLDTQFEAVSQAAMADLIVLSKTDLVPPAKTRHFEDRLRAINPTAQILHADHGMGATGQIWGAQRSAPRGRACGYSDLDNGGGRSDRPIGGIVWHADVGPGANANGLASRHPDRDGFVRA